MKTLKSVLAIIITLFLFDISGYSQKLNQIDFSIGPTYTGDISVSQLARPSFMSFATFSYTAELNYKKSITDRMQLGFGLVYSQQRSLYQTDTVDYHYRRGYIEVPLIFRYKFNRDTKNKFLLDAKIYNQFMTNIVSTQSGLEQEIIDRYTYEELVEYNFKMYNIAVSLGVSYERVFDNNLSFSLSPFVKYGLFSFHKQSSSHDISFGLLLGVGYHF